MARKPAIPPKSADPSTPAAELARLRLGGRARDNVALNPNADLETLYRLSLKVPSLVSQNAALPLLELEASGDPRLAALMHNLIDWEQRQCLSALTHRRQVYWGLECVRESSRFIEVDTQQARGFEDEQAIRRRVAAGIADADELVCKWLKSAPKRLGEISLTCPILWRDLVHFCISGSVDAVTFSNNTVLATSYPGLYLKRPSPAQPSYYERRPHTQRLRELRDLSDQEFEALVAAL